MRVLGIDPGYDRCGVAVVEKGLGRETLLYSECIQTSPKDSFQTRLGFIGSELEKIIAEYQPDTVAIESIFFNTNQTTVINVAGVRGMIAYISEESAIELKEFTPLQIKVATTGYGRSDKRQVISMVEKLIELPKKKRLDDEYDAIAVALTCLAHSRG